MTRKQRGFQVAFGLVAVTAMAGCGSLYGGGGGGTSIDITGAVVDVLPSDTGRDIVVFAFRLKNPQADCSNPVLPDNHTPYESVVLPAGETAFEIKHSKAGRIVLAFLLDNPGKDADGRIDPGDPVAVLNDPDCVLDDVPNHYVVEAADTRINFSLGDGIGFPAPGRAEAGLLREFRKP